jgi:hypothetical protein
MYTCSQRLVGEQYKQRWKRDTFLDLRVHRLKGTHLRITPCRRRYPLSFLQKYRLQPHPIRGSRWESHLDGTNVVEFVRQRPRLEFERGFAREAGNLRHRSSTVFRFSSFELATKFDAA